MSSVGNETASGEIQWTKTVVGLTFEAVGHPYREDATWWQDCRIFKGGMVGAGFRLELSQSEADDPDWVPGGEKLAVCADIVASRIATGDYAVTLS